MTHPVTPSGPLVADWLYEALQLDPATTSRHSERGRVAEHVALRAAQWGADQELEACCAIARVDPVCGTKHQRNMLVQHMREQRRPKPLSLKEQALERCNDYIDPDGIIRRALEALPE